MQPVLLSKNITEMTSSIVPRIIGHRGAAGYAPENTLASIRYAADLGIKWVELDVKITADGVPVLFHDNKLERTTNGQGYLANKTWNELETLDAGAWFGQSFSGERIPSLVELIAELDKLRLGVNLELKPNPRQDEKTGWITAQTVQALWPAKLPPPVISSFKAPALAAFAEVAPMIARALLVHKVPKDWSLKAQSLGISSFHCDSRYLKRRHVQSMRESGLTVRCFTVNEEERAAQLFSWGVESIFSDFPGRIT